MKSGRITSIWGLAVFTSPVGGKFFEISSSSLCNHSKKSAPSRYTQAQPLRIVPIQQAVNLRQPSMRPATNLHQTIPNPQVVYVTRPQCYNSCGGCCYSPCGGCCYDSCCYDSCCGFGGCYYDSCCWW
uniref:Uncharacterized protein n=1 Tax=Parascaris equorum TaxID=6256 RepID=A0A914S471_PAREQ